jgi:hypothetical protein
MRDFLEQPQLVLLQGILYSLHLNLCCLHLCLINPPRDPWHHNGGKNAQNHNNHQKLYKSKSLPHAKNKKTPPEGGAVGFLTLRIEFGIGE